MKLKISRLFHWLYATLMFLPILMFIPSCLYYAFNEHAVTSQETTVREEVIAQSNIVNTYQDLHINNIYYWEDTIQAGDISQWSLFNIYLDIDLYKIEFPEYETYDITQVSFYLDENLSVYNEVSGNNFNTFYQNLTNVPFNFIIINYTNISNIPNSILSHIKYSYLTYSLGYQDVQKTLGISELINVSWEGVWNLPVFSWTKNSFITTPFSYITGLFGLSSNNSLNFVFTYFVSISICWLVFDLIMYVPNLAHRWLDRSAIE